MWGTASFSFLGGLDLREGPVDQDEEFEEGGEAEWGDQSRHHGDRHPADPSRPVAEPALVEGFIELIGIGVGRQPVGEYFPSVVGHLIPDDELKRSVGDMVRCDRMGRVTEHDGFDTGVAKARMAHVCLKLAAVFGNNRSSWQRTHVTESGTRPPRSAPQRVARVTPHGCNHRGN